MSATSPPTSEVMTGPLPPAAGPGPPLESPTRSPPTSEVMTVPVRVDAVRGTAVESRTDLLAIEEPLEIRVVFGPRARREQKALAVTMRTPGHDAELAAGFLHGEGLLTDPDDIE